MLNGCSNFSSRVEPCFQAVRDNYAVDAFKAWLDDILTHTASQAELLDRVELFFQCCQKFNLKLSARKCKVFLCEVSWCSRIIDGQGGRFDPARLSGLQKIFMPKTAGELCEYVYCLQWMSPSIPNFAARIAPLREVLEEAYKYAGSRKKRAIKSLLLSNLS